MRRVPEIDRDVRESIRKIIAEELMVDIDEVKDEAILEEDLGADSLDAVELVMTLEGKFSIEIPDEEAEKVKTVGDAIELVEAKLKQRSKTGI